MESKQLLPLILDIGSDKFRLGWAGGDFPDLIALYRGLCRVRYPVLPLSARGPLARPRG
ncbi:MAG: hypothetical protein ACFFKA_10425, partial [Candidatus Thorarchaeota archaeon]